MCFGLQALDFKSFQAFGILERLILRLQVLNVVQCSLVNGASLGLNQL